MKTMGKAISYLAYGAVYGLWYVASLLPLRVLYVFSDLIYLVLGRLVKYRHNIIRKNLTTSFPEKTHDELRAIEHRFYRWFCDYLVETVKLMTMSRSQMMRRMQFTGMETINEIAAQGQSIAVYLGHYGQWEWITSLPYWVTDRLQCTEIYHPLENPYFDRLFRNVRQKRNSLCIPMAEVLRRVVEYRRQGQPIILGYISDQAPFWNNIHHWVNFLNHDTPVLTGGEQIQRKMNQAVFYGSVRRVRRGYYTCHMQLITRHPADIEPFGITDIYYRKLEESIRRDPTIYLWSHNRWKRTRQEFNIRLDKETGRVDLGPLEEIKRRKGIKP